MKNTEDLIINNLIDRVEDGTIDEVLQTVRTTSNRFGITYHFGIGLKISKEMIDDIKNDPSHWREMQKEIENE